MSKRSKEEKKIRKDKKDEFNPHFISKIQPRGGMKPFDNLIKVGDGYEAVIQIHYYPTSVNEYWLAPILNMENVIATVDIATEDKSISRTTLNRSLVEQFDRYHNGKEIVEKIEASSEIEKLKEITVKLQNNGEVMKLITVRLHLHEKTKADLEDKLKETLDKLSGMGYQGAVFISEQEFEWKSLLDSYLEQQKYPTAREGKGVPSEALAGAFPYNFSELKDPFGSYFGTTQTAGSVLLDVFLRDEYRKSYNGIIVGLMGSGKSTTLKKLVGDQVTRGNKVRGFDVVGEFEKLTRSFNGKTIKVDGSNGILNPLQILKTSEDEKQSYSTHISKTTTFYNLLNPSATSDVTDEFSLLLNKLYVKMGIKEKIGYGVTKLPANQYPIFDDLLALIISEMKNCKTSEEVDDLDASDNRFNRLDKIKLTIDNLIENYSQMFNGHSTLENFHDEQVVFFSLRSIEGLSRNIFDAQMFNFFTLVWENMLEHGMLQKQLFESGHLSFEDVVRYFVLIDEAHHFVNPQHKLLVKQLLTYVRESRKYFAGLWLATQSINDMVPEGTDLDTITDIKTLFELMQYKMVMQQDANTYATLSNVFKGELSESELDSIPGLTTGEMILVISRTKNIRFNLYASEDELALYEGGA